MSVLPPVRRAPDRPSAPGARRDGLAREAVDEADAARIAHHASLFARLGFAEKEAQHQAFLLYSYEVAESLLGRQGTAAEKKARAPLCKGWLYAAVLPTDGLVQSSCSTV